MKSCGQRGFEFLATRNQPSPSPRDPDLEKEIEEIARTFSSNSNFCEPPCHGVNYGVNYVSTTAGLSSHVLLVKRGRWDIWMNQVAARGASGHVGTNIIAVEARDVDGNESPKPKPFFFRYKDTGRGVEFTRERCVSCHLNGPRKVSPVPGTTQRKELSRLAGWNDIIAKYPKMDQTHLFDSKKIGPHLGKSRGCIQCHGDSGRPLLALSLSDRKSELVEPFVHVTQGWFEMPPTLKNGIMRPFFSAMSSAEKLGDTDRKELSEKVRALHRVGMAAGLQKPGAEVALDRKIQKEVLLFLQARGVLSSEEMSRAIDAIEKFDRQFPDHGPRFIDEAKDDVARWLKEPLRDCVSRAGPSVQSPGKKESRGIGSRPQGR